MNRIDAFFKLMNMHSASHLYLAAGRQPALRIMGDIQFVKYNRYEEEELKELIYEILPQEKYKALEKTGKTCFMYEISQVGRYRGHLYKQHRGLACVFKAVPNETKTIEELGLPQLISRAASLREGLIIVTGPKESGRTTTLGAIVREINRTRHAHILTIENLIEYVHTNDRSIIDQIEVGTHTPSYASGLRNALRTKPDVILLGEMRDASVTRLAIEAAGDGHLVLACMNTSGCGKSVKVIADRLQGTDQPNVYHSLLARSLKAVFSQVLFKRIDMEAYVPAIEILLTNFVVRNYIIEGRAYMIDLQKVILKHQKQGMQTLDDAIITLVEKGWIDPQDAYDKSYDKERFRTLLKESSEGPKVSTHIALDKNGLFMDTKSSIAAFLGKGPKELEQWLSLKGFNVSGKWEHQGADFGWKAFGFEGHMTDETIDSIRLNMIPEEDQKPFPFSPIPGISQMDNMEQVQKTLGMPTRKNSRTDLKAISFGNPSPLYPFAYYQSKGFYTRIEFTEGGREIREFYFSSGNVFIPEPFMKKADFEIKSRHMFSFKMGETVKLNTVDFFIKNEGCNEFIRTDGIINCVILRLSYLTNDEFVELSSGNIQSRRRRTMQWYNFRITKIDSNPHTNQATLVVEADDFESQDAGYHAFLKAARKGDGEAMYALSGAYQTGDLGLEKDEEKALSWCRESAENGFANPEVISLMITDIESKIMLGNYYRENGHYEEAFRFYMQAAEKGFTDAMYRVGVMYYDGEGIPKDEKKAIEWLTKAAKLESLKAKEKLYEIRETKKT